MRALSLCSEIFARDQFTKMKHFLTLLFFKFVQAEVEKLKNEPESPETAEEEPWLSTLDMIVLGCAGKISTNFAAYATM